MNYFSSDWHLSHTNVIKYDNRPFKNIGYMDSHIIAEAISVLREGDNFYYLGDFCFNKAKISEYLETLSLTGANLFFIKGNHDYSDTVKLYEKYGTYLGEKYSKLVIDDKQVVLDHFANRLWDRSHHGSYHLYGHSHDGLERTPWGRSMDCGIMTSYRINGNWQPFSWEQIDKILSKREIKLLDHHGRLNRDKDE